MHLVFKYQIDAELIVLESYVFPLDSFVAVFLLLQLEDMLKEKSQFSFSDWSAIKLILSGNQIMNLAALFTTHLTQIFDCCKQSLNPL